MAQFLEKNDSGQMVIKVESNNGIPHIIEVPVWHIWFNHRAGMNVQELCREQYTARLSKNKVELALQYAKDRQEEMNLDLKKHRAKFNMTGYFPMFSGDEII
jgi:uncharacterized protein (DUF433 family)